MRTYMSLFFRYKKTFISVFFTPTFQQLFNTRMIIKSEKTVNSIVENSF